ncbi:hypothetical protein FQA47_007507 [Oryzias melastigma]|uniref:Uncharacterized protein n=1 Tax=Oryzias melastigma TaxID=30732 RepID=A0A834EYQ9_ORYME|nr:hypothetical protein FQA47_007507 [Oryzias melastigma]
MQGVALRSERTHLRLCGAQLLSALLRSQSSGQVSAARLWKRSRTQTVGGSSTERSGAGFQRTALVRRRGERAVVCRSRLRAGMRQNPTRTSKSTDSES